MRVTRDCPNAGTHRALFGLLKEEFKRDGDPDSNGAFGRATVYPTIRLLA
jgi:hypothetical protein